jgi:hypothetical protein
LSRIAFGRVVWPLLVILLVIGITIILPLPPYSKEERGREAELLTAELVESKGESQ